MRILSAIAVLLICCFLAFALAPWTVQLTNQTHHAWSPTGENGDTNFYTAWTPATDGGPFNGGYLLGTSGDGWFNGVTAHILAMKMDSYNPSNQAGTVVSLAAGASTNSLSGWANPGVDGCMGASGSVSASAGYTPFSLRGKIYFPIQCQYDGLTFNTQKQAIIVSPDRMLHFCNWANYQSGGNAGANSCDAGNWSATGDVITGNSMTYKGVARNPIQWDLGDGNFGNQISRMNFVMWGQDTATGPVVPAGVDARIDTSYTYVITVQDACGACAGGAPILSTIYCRRFPTSGNPMDPSIWQHYSNGVWVSDWHGGSALTIIGSYGMHDEFNWSVLYSPTARRFFARTSGAMFYAFLPWGPWYQMPAIAPALSPAIAGYTGWIPPSYVDLGGGRWKASHTNNGNRPGADGQDYVVGFVEEQVGLSLFPMPAGIWRTR